MKSFGASRASSLVASLVPTGIAGGHGHQRTRALRWVRECAITLRVRLRHVFFGVQPTRMNSADPFQPHGDRTAPSAGNPRPGLTAWLLAAVLLFAGCSAPPLPPPSLVSSPAGHNPEKIALAFSAACPPSLVAQAASSIPTAIGHGVANGGLDPSRILPIGLIAAPALAATGGLGGAIPGVADAELAPAMVAWPSAETEARVREHVTRGLRGRMPASAGAPLQPLAAWMNPLVPRPLVARLAPSARVSPAPATP